jgi:hypothetical protein
MFLASQLGMNGSDAALKNGLLLAGRWLALVLLAELAAALLIAPDANVSEQLLLRAILVLILSVHLLPPARGRNTAAAGVMLSWCLLSGPALLAGLVFMPGGLPPAAGVGPLTGGLMLLVLLFGSLTLALARRLDDCRLASRIGMGLLLISLSVPLWAAPLILTGFGAALVDTIIALCPVSYLASLADIDYLRSDWWYQHMPYGGMRYNYADPMRLTLAMLGSVAAIGALGSLRRPGPGSEPFPTLPLTQEMKL